MILRKFTKRITDQNWFAVTIVICLIAGVAPASQSSEQETPAVPGDDIILKPKYLIDSEADKAFTNLELLIRDEKIVEIGKKVNRANIPKVIELPDHTILPGFIDVHTHVMMNGADDYGAELYKKTYALRALEAVPNLKTSLMNGFTTLRDVGNEGSMYADVDVRTALENGWIMGPRLFVSTRGISTTGRYPPRGYNIDLNLPKGTQWVVGKDAGIAAVREQIAGGADWVKIYTDWAVDSDFHGSTNFTQEELAVMVSEVHRYGLKAAAHAGGIEGIKAALDAGIDSIEHGEGFNRALIEQAKEQGVTWVPTLTGYEAFNVKNRLANAYQSLKIANEEGLSVAVGTDAGAYNWQKINQAKEFEHLVKGAGLSPMDAIKAGTSVGAKLLDGSDKFGSLKVGMIADIVAVKGDPLTDITLLQSVCLVMQGGKIVKNECGAK